MTDFISSWVECDECGENFPADIAENLHVTESRDLRARILDGTFHRFACRECGKKISVEKLLAYSDFSRHHWFVVVPGKEFSFHHEWPEFAEATFRSTMIERCPDFVREVMAPRMVRRVIFGLASLREKLVCFEAGLDDRALEVLKAETLCDLGLRVSVRDHFFLDSVAPDLLHFEYGVAEFPGATALCLPRAAYDNAANGDACARWPEFFGDNLIVDYRAAALSPTSQLWREA